jgi:hypothetical protein
MLALAAVALGSLFCGIAVGSAFVLYCITKAIRLPW